MAIHKGFDFLVRYLGEEYLFRIDRKSYRFSDLSAYAPRSAAGGLTLADLNHINAWEQLSFHGGMGHLTMTDAQRYRSSDGVDPRNSGMLTLAPAKNTLNIGLTGRISMAVTPTHVYFGGIGGVFEWNGVDAPATINTGLANSNVLSLFWNGENLFCGLDEHRIHIYDFDLNEWNETGQIYGDLTDDFSATCFEIHNGAHWHAQKGTNLIHFWHRGDGEDAETGIAVGSLDGSYEHPAEGADYDPWAIEVGPLGREVKKLVSYNGFLYAFREDGIWEVFEYQDNRFGTRLVKNLTNYANFENFDAVVRRDDGMWMGHSYKVERFTVQTEADFTPNPVTDEFPPIIHDKAQAMYDIYGWLFVLLSGQLYAFNGTSVHVLELNVTGPDTDASRELGSQPATMGYFLAEGMLVSAVYNGTSTDIYWWGMTDRYSRAPYQESGWLETSSFDGGFKAVPKYWHSVKLETHIPDEGGRIEVTAYSHHENSIDTYYLGEINSTNAAATVDGRWNRALVTFEFPKTATGKWLDLKFELFRGADVSDPTPIVYGWILEYVQRNPTMYGFAPVIQLDDTDSTADGWRDLPVKEKLQTLLDMRDSVEPLYFEDLFGHKGWGYISAITGREREIKDVAAWDERSVDVAISIVMLTRECDEVLIGDAETLTIEDRYRVSCRLVIEGTGRLVVENT